MNEAYEPRDSTMAYAGEFDYSVWTPGTTVTLCSVTWDAAYRDIVTFPNPAAILAHLAESAGPSVEINNMTYAAYGQPVHIPVSFNKANKYNYLIVTNPLHPTSPDEQRHYYYFITDVEYVAPNTTRLNVQLDVWTTYQHTVNFGNAFLERGHLPMANRNEFTNFGRDHLIEPEGLDIGSEYVIRKTKTWSLIDATSNDDVPDYNIAIYSTTSLHQRYGTRKDPILRMADGSSAEGLPNGMALYVVPNVKHLNSLLFALSQYPWVTQGITSIQALPRDAMNKLADSYYIVEYSNDDKQYVPRKVEKPEFDAHQYAKFAKATAHTGSSPATASHTLELFRDAAYPNDKYARLKKFKTYPYMFIEATMYNGTPLIIKPELIDGHGLIFQGLAHYTVPSPRMVIYPRHYNVKHTNPSDTNNYSGEFLDYCTGITNFPTFSTLNNAYTSFLASNQASIAYQHQSADWSQQRALMGANVARNNAASAMDNMGAQNAYAVSARNQSLAVTNNALADRNFVGAVGGVVSGVVGGAKGGVAGAAMGALGAGITAGQNTAIAHIQMSQNRDMNSIQNTQASNSLRSNMAYSRNVADRNLGYAQDAAAGDYANTIAGINAKVQDAKMLQPTTSGQIGGDAFNLTTIGWRVDFKWKTLSDNARRTIGDFWFRYGYAVNRFVKMPDNLCPMSKFTYWKLQECYLTSSSCPELFKQTIRGIFEKGVTVWKNSAEIGNVDISTNGPKDMVIYE